VLDPLKYYSNPQDSIRPVSQIENLFILPSLGVQRQAAAILESTEMKHILEDARTRFDFVVLDAPALSLCNDALLLEPFTDGIVLATRPGYTEEGMINEVAEQFLDSDDVQLLGAVVDDADMKVSDDYAHHEEPPPLTLDTLNGDGPAPEAKDELEQISSSLRE
jgi:Mrp family chromosome partitioning ATPase